MTDNSNLYCNVFSRFCKFQLQLKLKILMLVLSLLHFKSSGSFQGGILCALGKQGHIFHGPVYIVVHETKPVIGRDDQIRVGTQQTSCLSFLTSALCPVVGIQKAFPGGMKV